MLTPPSNFTMKSTGGGGRAGQSLPLNAHDLCPYSDFWGEMSKNWHNFYQNWSKDLPICVRFGQKLSDILKIYKQ